MTRRRGLGFGVRMPVSGINILDYRGDLPLEMFSDNMSTTSSDN